jgi:cytochrome b561
LLIPIKVAPANCRKINEGPIGADVMILESTRYPALVRWVHWSSVLLVVLAYATSEAADDLQPGGAGQWHVLAGLLLLVLFVPRLVGYVLRRRGAPLPGPEGGPAARIAAVTVHMALLLFVVVEPLLGILALWAEGEALPVPFTPWVVPPLLAMGARAGELLEELHETVGNIFYAVIGVHVLASLWHHFVRRDAVLRRML